MQGLVIGLVGAEGDGIRATGQSLIGALAREGYFGLLSTRNGARSPEPTAADALPLALRRIEHSDFDDSTALDANYLRRTDAEIFAKPRPSMSLPAAHGAAEPPPDDSAIQLRPAVTTDLNSILALDRATENAPHWPLASYATVRDAGDQSAIASQQCLFVAYNGDLLIGFAVGLLNPAPSQSDGAWPNSKASSSPPLPAGQASAAPSAPLSSPGAAPTAQPKSSSRSALPAPARSHSIPASASRAIGRRPGYYRNPDDDALSCVFHCF